MYKIRLSKSSYFRQKPTTNGYFCGGWRYIACGYKIPLTTDICFQRPYIYKTKNGACHSAQALKTKLGSLWSVYVEEDDTEKVVFSLEGDKNDERL